MELMSLPDLIGRCALGWLGAPVRVVGDRNRSVLAMAMRTVRRMSGSASKPWRRSGSTHRRAHGFDASALVGPDQLGLGEYVPLGDRLDLGAAGVGSHRQAWLAQRHQAEVVVVHAMALRWARSGVAGGAEVVDRLLQAVAQGLGAVPFRQLDPISRDVAGGRCRKV